MKNIKFTDWTHKSKSIKDIRKLSDLYSISIEDNEITEPLFVNSKIFEYIIKSYFLVDNINVVNRKDILDLKWNFIITKGYYVKIYQNDIDEIQGDTNKWYISFLEIDSQLGSFKNLWNKSERKEKQSLLKS